MVGLWWCGICVSILKLKPLYISSAIYLDLYEVTKTPNRPTARAWPNNCDPSQDLADYTR